MPSRSPSMLSANKTLIIILLAILVGAGALFLTKDSSGRQAAPDLTYVNLKGEKITSTSLRGKVYMVNFWATSCTTCVAEMPEMIGTYDKFHSKGLEFVAVAMRYDPPNYVINFTETRALPFHVALDVEGKLAEAFGDVKLTPTTFLIDKQGRIIKRYVGKPSFDELEEIIGKELSAS
ncbi:TlpA family protein disulfide reductase [Undibacterium sp. LX40W]|uniref:TlpA family protein disulfide reductase n=2 Tax=Oxalobacteraceae TaxID=75682 RepID=A0A923HPS0_9BURK|nr:TlpA family protein disulfide reductase [Undibacterium nitidum]MBC3891554.1 TlpA family protein disulfide reductase [Undibacterium sp. LX40W]